MPRKDKPEEGGKSDLEGEKQKGSGNTIGPLLNNFLSASIFAAFIAAVTRYIKIADDLPEKFRLPLYLTAAIVLVVILMQFAYTTIRLMHRKLIADLKLADNQAAHLDIERKRVQLADAKLDKEIAAVQNVPDQSDLSAKELAAGQSVIDQTDQHHSTAAATPTSSVSTPQIQNPQYKHVDDVQSTQTVLGLGNQGNE